jgi:putative transposase
VKGAKFAFMSLHLGEYRVSSMCRALGVTRQGYYQWASRTDSAHDLRDLELTRLIGDEYDASLGIYGAPKVFERLRRKGVRTSRRRVARIMRENGWKGVTRACAKRPDGGEKRASKKDSHEDLVKRDFSADGPNRAWFADITYVRTRQGWLYLAVVMDVWSRMVVGWSMGPRITAELADDALKMAIARRRPDEGCIHHSDHGAQYVSLLLGRTMRDAGIRPSMGSVSSPWDNAVTESLMGVIKSECVHARTFDSREQAALELFEYIERFYNRVRIHSALGWLSPAEFEERHVKGSRPEAA